MIARVHFVQSLLNRLAIVVFVARLQRLSFFESIRRRLVGHDQPNASVGLQVNGFGWPKDLTIESGFQQLTLSSTPQDRLTSFRITEDGNVAHWQNRAAYFFKNKSLLMTNRSSSCIR